MSRNAAKIKTALRELSSRPYEVRSGVIIAGSLDTAACTADVETAEGTTISGVRLNGTTGNDSGWITYPKDDSVVVIASIDGEGEWVLVRATEITKAAAKIDDVTLEVSAAGIRLAKGSVVLEVSDHVWKLNTASENLHTLLKDLLTAIMNITVGTGTGPSSVPINAADFVTLQTRLDHLLGT